MIAKAVKGSGARGVLNYAIEKEGSEKIGGNMAGDTPRELSAEFSASRRLRPNLGKAVHHVSLSLGDGERLTDAQWRKVADTYREKMGFEGSQFVLVRHSDQDHDHVHLIQSRIRLNGSVVNDSKDYERQEEVMRQVEREFGLESGERQSTRRALTKGEIAKAERTGEAPTRARLHAACCMARDHASDLAVFRSVLEDRGVKSELTASGGLVLELDGIKFSASKVDRAFSVKHLQKTWSKRDGQGQVLGERCTSRDRDAAGQEATRDRNRGAEAKRLAGNQQAEIEGGGGRAANRDYEKTDGGGGNSSSSSGSSNYQRSMKKMEAKKQWPAILPGQHGPARPSPVRDNFGNSLGEGVEFMSGADLARLRQIEHLQKVQGVENRPDRQTFLFTDGARVVSDSAGIRCQEITPVAADRMMAIAKERGWKSVQVFGTLEEKLKLCEAAQRAGLEIENPPVVWLKRKKEEERQKEEERRKEAAEQLAEKVEDEREEERERPGLPAAEPDERDEDEDAGQREGK